MKKINNISFYLVALGISVLLPIQALTQTPALPKSIGIATHPKGSTLNIIGSAFAKVISSNLNITATDRPFTGYIGWIPLLDKGEIEMGISTSPDPYFAYHGMEPYRERLKNLRMISSGATLDAGFVVRASSGIKTMAQLKGKRVCIDRTSLATKRYEEGVLKAAGLDLKKDITVINVAGVTEAVQAVTEGRADAAWSSVGMAVVKELSANVGGIYWLSVVESPNHPSAKILLEEAPGCNIIHIKAGTRPTVDNDGWFTAVHIYLMSYKGLSEVAAYQITKLIWEKQEELIPIHPMFKDWGHKAMIVENAVIPYHPGAIRFYKEVGAWSNKMDQIQQKLLSQ